MLPSQRIPYRKHTHARATVTNVVHPDGRVFGAYASGVPGIVKHGGRKFTQIEKAATNYLDVDPLDLTAWTKINGTETTAKNVVAGPRGDVTASSLSFAADATDGAKGQISTIANSAKCCGSLWAKTASGTQTFRIAVLKKDGNVAISADKTATTTWQRFYYYLSDVLTGATVPEMRIVNGSAGAAGTIYVWCPQAEVAAYPSSPITTAKGTRNKDENYIAAASMPSNARSKFTLHISPDHASTDLAAADERDLFDADDDLCHVKGYVLNGAIGVKGVLDTLKASVDNAPAFCADDNNVYYGTAADGTARVVKQPKNGAAATNLATSQYLIYGMACDATYVYWGENKATGRMLRVPIAGGAVEDLIPGSNQQSYDCVVDATYLYWGDRVTGNINRCPLAGAVSATTLATDPGTAGGVISIAIDAANVYWINVVDAKLYSCPIGGGAVSTIATSLGTTPLTLLVDATYAYIAVHGTGAILRVTLVDGTKTTLASSQTGPAGLAIDSAYVYWTTTDGYARRVPIATGTVETLTSDSGVALAAAKGAVGQSNFYWSARKDTGGSIRKQFAHPIASGAHTWSAKPSTPPSITFDAANKQIVTANFDSGSGTTTGSGAYTTTGGNVYIGEDAAGANQFDGLISEVEIG